MVYADVISTITLLATLANIIITWRMNKEIHEPPRIKYDIKYSPYDASKTLDKRFTEPVDRLIISVTNLSYKPFTISSLEGEFNLGDSGVYDLAGKLYNSFLEIETRDIIGKKLQQSDVLILEIRDYKVLDTLKKLVIVSTHGHPYVISENELSEALEHRGHFLKKHPDTETFQIL